MRNNVCFDTVKVVDDAIDAYINSDCSNDFFDFLVPKGRPSFGYWQKVAKELHRRELFYLSVDCWLECEKYIDDDHLSYVYSEMVASMVSAGDYHEALGACNRLLKIKNDPIIASFKSDITKYLS